ncbi:hypothetical protein DPMN_109823 [Dreissena polymorpha]|uniref:Uncharacterized protein n=1 Tax=Dreissena polymorpha TaxID=45954 RepID=A0A9D4KB07_DREPO|nr:hypothetical protein DPMN_109823 [Dreissena polymorpha]
MVDPASADEAPPDSATPSTNVYFSVVFCASVFPVATFNTPAAVKVKSVFVFPAERKTIAFGRIRTIE